MSVSEKVESSSQQGTVGAKPRIAIIIGSTRDARIADKPAQWILKQAQARGEFNVEVLDLRDYPMPFFNEAASDRWVPSKSQEARHWQEAVARFDGYIFVVCEYNHSITGVFKKCPRPGLCLSGIARPSLPLVMAAWARHVPSSIFG